MRVQIRTYTINKGQLEQFAQEFDRHLRPLREKIGFKVLGAWKVPAANQFVWVMGLENGDDWERLDKAYFDSDERKAMQPDPGRLIARMENHFAEPAL